MNIINAPIEKIKTHLVVRKPGGMDIDGMMRSIERHGLLHPIGLTSDYELVYGWRRFQACELLKMDTIPAVFVRNEHLRYQIMKTENNLREELTPEEKVLLAQKLEEEIKKNQPALWQELGLITNEPGNEGGNTEQSKAEKNEPVSQVCPNSDKSDRKDKENIRPDDAAAKTAGLGGRDKYRKAETVVNQGSQPLKDAMNQNKVSINAAYQLSKLPEEEQAAIDYDDKQAVKEKVRQIRNPPEKPAMNTPKVSKDAINPEIVKVVAITDDWPKEQLLKLIDVLRKKVNGKGKQQ